MEEILNARFVAVMAALGLVLSGTPALAQTDDEAARAHFRSGTAYFERGDYDAALREFQASLEQSGRAELLYNIASCHERLDHLAQAVEAFDRYLREVPDVQGRGALEARVDRLRERIVASGRPRPGDATTGAAADNTRVDDPTPSGGVPALSWISWSVGAAGLVAFGVFGVLTVGEHSDLESTCGTACSPDQVSSLETYGLVADVGLAVGLVGAAVGVVSLLVAPDSRESTTHARVLLRRDRLGLVVRF